MNLKVFIVCLDKSTSLKVAKDIVFKNDDISIAPIFTTDASRDIIDNSYETYLDANVVNLSYKNNSLLYIITNNYVSSGITIDDFYNNDICIMTINEYNLIPEVIFNKYNILTVWIDSKNHSSLSKNDLNEIKYFSKFLEQAKYLYFLDTESNIDDVIIDYFNGDDETKLRIEKENN